MTIKTDLETDRHLDITLNSEHFTIGMAKIGGSAIEPGVSTYLRTAIPNSMMTKREALVVYQNAA